MARERTSAIENALRELTFALQEKNPRENADDFSDFAEVVRRWVGHEHQPFLGLWQKLGTPAKALPAWASGESTPTPRMRARIVALVEEWVAWIAKEYPSA